MNGQTEEVADPYQLVVLRRRARRIQLQSLAATVVVAVALLLLG